MAGYCDAHVEFKTDVAEIKADVKNIDKKVDVVLEEMRDERKERKEKLDKWVFILAVTLIGGSIGSLFIYQVRIARELSTFQGNVSFQGRVSSQHVIEYARK